MDPTEKLLKTGFDWLNENASGSVGICNDRSSVGICHDRSCIRCRLADVLFEINERFNTTPDNSNYTKHFAEPEKFVDYLKKNPNTALYQMLWRHFVKH